MDKIAMLTEILTANPADSFARYGLAMEYLSQDNTDKALEEFASTIQHNADYVPAYQMRGQTLAKLHRTDEAKECLQAGLAAAQRTGNGHASSEMGALLDELEQGY
jgi:Tfp pilus assembly protein PilF